MTTSNQPEQAGDSFQQRVAPWMQECFGAAIASDVRERGDRLLEEVLELLQSHGYDPARVATLRDYVFGRPVGEPTQEVGGVMVTLAAYCLATGIDMHEAGDTELSRIWTKVEQIRAKQASKRDIQSPLPTDGPDQANELTSSELSGHVAVQPKREADGSFWIVVGPYNNPRDHGTAMQQITAALTANAKASSLSEEQQSCGGEGRVPDGWALVPCKVTREMLVAYWDDGDDPLDQSLLVDGDLAKLQLDWDRMLAATPTPPTDDKSAGKVEALVDALQKIAKSDPGEGGCYYTNRTNIAIAKRALAATTGEHA